MPSAAVTVAVSVTLVAVVTPVLGVAPGAVVVVAVCTGPVALVVYVPRRAATVTKMDWTWDSVPVPPPAL